MKVQFNFDKKHFYILLVIFAIFGGIIYVRGLASSVPPTPWHPLQEVSTSSSGTTSVDVDANGVVDDSDNSNFLDGKDSTYFENLAQSTNAVSLQGENMFWETGNKLCYNTSGTCGTQTLACNVLSGGTAYEDNKFNAACSNLQCDQTCKTTPACDGELFFNCGFGTQDNFNSGTCAAAFCSGDVCACNCNNNPASNYVKETLTGTKKCATFV